MSPLPLQIRKDIRDFFDNDERTVQKSFQTLSKIIGYPVSCNVEWQMLWAELEAVYADKATFVPCAAAIVETWCHVLGSRLEDDKFQDWTEEFLSKLESVGTVRLFIQTSDVERPTTSWSYKKPAFAISLPKSRVAHGTSAAPGFATDFETIFHPREAPRQIEKSQITSKDDEDWAEIESIGDSKGLSIKARAPDGGDQKPDSLPALQTLPRPDILFQTLTPYLIQVSSVGANKITVTGSHEPSLRLLAEYLQRWVKHDPQDVRKVPYLSIKFAVSNFGLGILYDAVTIEPFDSHQRHVVVNPVLILTFIQGVLGYHPIPETSGAGYWEFKRTLPLAP